jgi:predicted nucleic acid-binding protein
MIKQKIIIDSNIVFSAFLNINSRIGQILISGYSFYHFYAPNYIRTEIIEHKEKIKKLADISENEFLEISELLFKNIIILNHNLIPASIYLKAKKLCEDIDVDDTPFIALTDYLKGKFWTGDLKLINGLSAKNYKQFVRTETLFQDFILKVTKNPNS